VEDTMKIRITMELEDPQLWQVGPLITREVELKPDQKDLNGFILKECSTNSTVLIGMLNDLNDVLANTLAP
jgi:hypothetical protein